MGPNGSGKTTLLRGLADLTPCQEGLVSVSDPPLFLSTRGAVREDLSVHAQLQFWRDLYGGQAPTDLTPFHSTLIRDLSLGQRQRVALARLRIDTSPIWLLDEPFQGLDTANQECLAERVRAHQRAGGIIVLATHALHGLTPTQTLSLGSA